MIIKELTIINFRNHKNFKINFKEGTNIIVGKNGAGKTNILEAIFLMSTTISHRTNLINDLIKEGKDAFNIMGRINDNSGKLDIGIEYKKGEGLKAGINFSRVKRKALIERFPVVAFSPEDIEMLKGSPDKLRKIMNIINSQIKPPYINYLIRYKKLLKERNILLKEGNIKGNQRAGITLNAWTETLQKYAGKITCARKIFITDLNNIIKVELREIGLDSKLEVKYSTNCFEGDKSIRNDLNFGYTTWGPHRETYSFYLNNKNLRKYGSRGEARIAALVFRLAVWRILKNCSGREPIVLLDDVFSELDEEKRNIIKMRLKNVQSIVTLTEIPADLNLTANIIPI